MHKYKVTWYKKARTSLRGMKDFLTKEPEVMFKESKRILNDDPKGRGTIIDVVDSDYFGLFYFELSGGAIIVYDVIDSDETVAVYECISNLTGDALREVYGEYDPL